MAIDSPRELSRRDLLRAIALGSVAAGLAACGATPSAPPASAVVSPSPAGSPSPGASPVVPTPPSSGAPSATPSSAPSTAPSAVPSPTPAGPSDRALRQKIGQLLVAGFVGQKASKSTPVGRAIAAGELGGVIIFDRNIVSSSQLSTLTRGLAGLAPAGRPLLVAVDQEGGKVLRLGPSHGFPDVPSQQVVGSQSTAVASSVYAAMARTLSRAGITLNLAPVVDINVNPRNPAIGALHRSFSADPAVVTAMSRAAIGAYHDHGIRAAIKHFPGLGSAVANSDDAIVDVTETWSDSELDPYRGLLGGFADCVMVGHIDNRNIDATQPASLSGATLTGLLRGVLGWQGPVITDDMQAVAITDRFARADAMAAALNAGADLLLYSKPTADSGYYTDIVDTIEALVMSGRVDEARIDESVARVATLRGPR